MVKAIHTLILSSKYEQLLLDPNFMFLLQPRVLLLLLLLGLVGDDHEPGAGAVGGDQMKGTGC